MRFSLFVRIVCVCGGITGAMKIAAMAEAFGVRGWHTHNPLSTVSTAASLSDCCQRAKLRNSGVSTWTAGAATERSPAAGSKG
ncbi:MAG: enolase C-terminal domain-like protein [Anaerobutyricum soehngenii]